MLVKRHLVSKHFCEHQCIKLTPKNMGIDTKIIFLLRKQVILHAKLSFVAAMLNFPRWPPPLLISTNTNRLGTLINIG